MSKEELFKKYQEILLKTNGGADDYVVALCQISDLIDDYAEEKSQQICDLEAKLKALQNGIIDDKTLNMLVKEHKLYKDLETKLAEAQKTIEIQKMSNNALQEENLDYRYDITDTAYEQAKYMAESWEEDYQQETTQLKQQLHDLPKKIVEEIRKWGQKHYNWVGDGTGYDGQDYNECIGFNMAIDQLNEILDTILKKFGGENE